MKIKYRCVKTTYYGIYRAQTKRKYVFLKTKVIPGKIQNDLNFSV